MNPITRESAIRAVLEAAPDALVVSANGFISRETFSAGDRPENFYMIGSMGLAGSIGLGLALARPDRRVVVLDGDGNCLMNFGSFATAGDAAPKNFFQVILDNGAYDSTGGQRTSAGNVDFAAVAKACGFAWVKHVDGAGANDRSPLQDSIREMFAAGGPALLHVKLSPGTGRTESKRIPYPPEEIAKRVRMALGVK
ncbi:MAG: thiamine pyrophosphate-dependent enzyme [Planctomycetota bacterium]